MKKHHISKSFFCLGKDLGPDKCLNCAYCRLLNNETRGLNFWAMPGDINPLFLDFPAAINLFFGDPFLQTDRTINLLKRLEKSGHRGPVIIITKAPVKKLSRIKEFNLDLHICASTFGIDHRLDGGSRRIFEKNLKELHNYGIKTSIEFRPIIYNINDSHEAIEYVFGRAAEYGVPIGYCGLQGKPEVITGILKRGYIISPYPGTKFSKHKKHLGQNIEEIIINMSLISGIPVFKKTSCLITYQHGLGRDYNAHYYRPGEVGCDTCVMKEKCFKFYNSIDKLTYEKTKKILPYDHSVVYKYKHTCILAKQGICESVTEHCHNIKGYLIKTDKILTTADVRATKWLTGLTMDVRMRESFVLSDIWKLK